jgi:hypothetical protein
MTEQSKPEVTASEQLAELRRELEQLRADSAARDTEAHALDIERRRFINATRKLMWTIPETHRDLGPSGGIHDWYPHSTHPGGRNFGQ